MTPRKVDRPLALVVGIILIIVASASIGASVRAADLTQGTRRVLCVGITHNTENTARFDPIITKECAEVGIHATP